MFAKLHEDNIHNNLIDEPDFVYDWNEYAIKYGVGSNSQAQHNYMANEYRNYNSKGLKDFFQNETYYQNYINYVSDMPNWSGLDYMLDCLTWGGLKNTDAWDSIKLDPTALKKYEDQKRYIIKLLPKDCN
jgi:hypothetical protein